MEQVHAMIAMFDKMDNTYGGVGVHTSIVNYLTVEVVPMLQKRGTVHHQRKQLFTAAAKLAATAEWSRYDSADYGMAQRYMIQALPARCGDRRRRVRRRRGDRDQRPRCGAGQS
ncbi:hypothetical protein [Streptomyces jumonjinensis]|uniref:hypothetical protein n=1 Tax=Streptomyces jumonjinensis TaxID=1945 RepID=UPI003789A88A